MTTTALTRGVIGTASIRGVTGPTRASQHRENLLTDGGVTERTRSDLTSDDLTGVNPHPQLKVHTVALSQSTASRRASS